MNEQNTMQPLGETKSLQNIVIDEVCQKFLMQQSMPKPHQKRNI